MVQPVKGFEDSVQTDGIGDNQELSLINFPRWFSSPGRWNYTFFIYLHLWQQFFQKFARFIHRHELYFILLCGVTVHFFWHFLFYISCKFFLKFLFHFLIKILSLVFTNFSSISFWKLSLIWTTWHVKTEFLLMWQNLLFWSISSVIRIAPKQNDFNLKNTDVLIF